MGDKAKITSNCVCGTCELALVGAVGLFLGASVVSGQLQAVVRGPVAEVDQIPNEIGTA